MSCFGLKACTAALPGPSCFRYHHVPFILLVPHSAPVLALHDYYMSLREFENVRTRWSMTGQMLWAGCTKMRPSSGFRCSKSMARPKWWR